VTFLEPKVGGRKTPVRSGYRGQFFYDGMDCDAVHFFDVEGDVPFHEEVQDAIYLANPVHRGRLREGMIFLIREGPQTVGYGQVLKVNSPPS
jgi:translation elongation factor EF-Tu-like GTPase